MLKDRQEGFYGGIELGDYAGLGGLGVYAGRLWASVGLLI